MYSLSFMPCGSGQLLLMYRRNLIIEKLSESFKQRIFSFIVAIKSQVYNTIYHSESCTLDTLDPVSMHNHPPRSPVTVP